MLPYPKSFLISLGIITSYPAIVDCFSDRVVAEGRVKRMRRGQIEKGGRDVEAGLKPLTGLRLKGLLIYLNCI